MKHIIALSLLVLVAFGLQAQNRILRIHSNGQEVYTQPTTGSNRMYFNGGTAIFNHNGTEWSTRLLAIDSITFATAGDDDPNTDPATIDSSLVITITWQGNEVAIDNPFSSQGVAITHNGGHVSVNSTMDTADLVYRLCGSSTNGSLTMVSSKKMVLCLDTLTLTNASGPVIWVNSDKRASIFLTGVSTLSDGTANAQKAALQCRGKLQFHGTGALLVAGLAKHAIQSSGSTTLSSGTIQVLGAKNDGLNVDNFIMNGGSLTVTSSGDGVDADQGYILISGGSINISCDSNDVKGLCADSTITITGGNISVTVNGDQSKAIRTKSNMTISGGQITVQANGSVALEPSGSGYEPSYCTGIKIGGNLLVLDGSITVDCPASNAGGKAISADGNCTISGGTLNLSATGSCAKYSNANGTYDSYASTCIKSNGNVNIDGGTLSLVAGGRGIKCDGNYTQTKGIIHASTSSAGFTTIGSGTSCTDGFAPACLNADGDIYFQQGLFEGTSTGKGGRGITANGKLVVGTPGGNDSQLTIYITTSGAPVNSTSGGGGWPGGGGGSSNSWKGLPKGIKIQDSIHVYSGRLMSYCQQTSGDPTAEAIESKGFILIDGGIIEANSYDDAINATTGLTINDGKIFAYSRGNDGIDNNGSYTYINGGTVIALSDREVGFDASTDAGGHFYITGGTVVSKGGNMGAWDTPTMSGTQKKIMLATSFTITNGFCIKNSSGDEVLTFHLPTFSGSGFDYGTGSKPPPGGGGGNSRGGIGITCPGITSGTYTAFSSPTISGGTNWHGLYDGATVSTTGSGTSVSAQ